MSTAPLRSEAAAETLFAHHPAPLSQALLALRAIILQAGSVLDERGGLLETTKWGQLSFLPNRPKIGSTLRIDGEAEPTLSVSLYVHCQTRLIDMFRTRFPELTYIGNREVRFDARQPLPEAVIGELARTALTYHLIK